MPLSRKDTHDDELGMSNMFGRSVVSKQLGLHSVRSMCTHSRPNLAFQLWARTGADTLAQEHEVLAFFVLV
jgi:hypothetical protein